MQKQPMNDAMAVAIRMASGIHTGSGQDGRIDCENVSHGHKGCQTGYNFCLDIRVILLQFEE